ncbi:MAG: UDP-N-acetylmuramoyl-L-alanine--D-glutamate ligase [Candidatus Kapaibacterium sp.]
MKYTVIGAARSGVAAAILAAGRGHDVFVSEAKPRGETEAAADALDKAGIEAEFGGNSDKCYDCDVIIASPGIPPTAPVILEAESRGISIISELEFAAAQINNPIIAITGTNGKTTTTALTEFLLRNSCRKAIAVGNIGTALSAVVDRLEPDTIVVAEVSSFQLDRIVDFRPDVAIITNITPDHIGYHGSMEKYIEAKLKITKNQTKDDLLILNFDDETCRAMAAKSRARIAYFSMESHVDWGIRNVGGRMNIISDKQHEGETIMLFEEIKIPGVHNAYNSMAAALAARAFEVSNENIRDSLMKFAGVEHRLEFVRTFEGVDYINDSKATNVNATWYALRSYRRPVIWIAGGRGDNNEYSQLAEAVDQNVKAIVAIGEERDAIFNYFCTRRRCIKADSLADAVREARELADYGDVVLFTPACKSFDMFMNYEHRGEVYKEIVFSLD